jgi:PAS domain S-box-containing protein
VGQRPERVDYQLGRLFELSLDAFCIAGFDGHVKLANPAWARMLGYTQQELLTRPFVDNVHPDDVESVGALLVELAAGKDIVGFECRQVCADGSVRWFEWNTRTAPEEGVVYGVGRDVTERRVVNAELDALRRVATLVARGVPPEELFAAVTDEVGRLLAVDHASLGRYEPGGTFTIVAWSGIGGLVPPRGSRVLGGKNITTLVFETGRAARIDNYADASGPLGVGAREDGVGVGVGTPVIVDGRLWGVMATYSTLGRPLPPDTEARLSNFTELVATAIANAESTSELAASRRRIVAASDETRRRIERDLHDGTQQRLVSLGLALRTAEARIAPDGDELRTELSNIATGLAEALSDLQEISRGIHPAILTKGGIRPALQTLARRSTIPVELDVTLDARLAEPIEAAVYFVASEALANAAKHARASRIEISLAMRDGRLALSVHDDGVGGADVARGSGLVGLADRVEALGGQIDIRSLPGDGTHIAAELPFELPIDADPEPTPPRLARLGPGSTNHRRNPVAPTTTRLGRRRP